jgi:hypothetical protein
MLTANATVATERPERYIKQLISHLGHKLTTEITDDGVGTVITRGGSRCTLTPATDGLHMSATAADQEALHGIQDLVGRHLVRFAAREDLDVTWVARQ